MKLRARKHNYNHGPQGARRQTFMRIRKAMRRMARKLQLNSTFGKLGNARAEYIITQAELIH